MKARTVSLTVVGLLVVGGAAGIVGPRIAGSGISGAVGASTGSGTISAYCAKITAKQSQIANVLSSSDPTALVDNLALFQSLAVNAPSDITASWTALNTAIGSLASAIKASGHQPSDFSDGQFPAGISQSQEQAIKNAASTLTSSVTETAAVNIEQEVRDVCQVDLGT